MNEQQALQILEWNIRLDPEEYADWQEEWIFDRSKEVLLKAYAPVLIQKRIDEMNKVLDALQVLGFFLEKKESLTITADATDGLSFLRSYEKNKALAKTAIAQSRTISDLQAASCGLKAVVHDYLQRFDSFFPEIEKYPDAVKSQEELDTARVIMALKNGPAVDEIAGLLSKEKARIAFLQSL